MTYKKNRPFEQINPLYLGVVITYYVNFLEDPDQRPSPLNVFSLVRLTEVNTRELFSSESVDKLV